MTPGQVIERLTILECLWGAGHTTQGLNFSKLHYSLSFKIPR